MNNQHEVKTIVIEKSQGFSLSTISKLGKGANVTTDVLVKICEALNCNLGDIMELIKV